LKLTVRLIILRKMYLICRNVLKKKTNQNINDNDNQGHKDNNCSLLNLDFSPLKTIQRIVINVNICELNILVACWIQEKLRGAVAAHKTKLRVVIHIVVIGLRLSDVLGTFCLCVELGFQLIILIFQIGNDKNVQENNYEDNNPNENSLEQSFVAGVADVLPLYHIRLCRLSYI
jgi:hypothetical protein